MIKRLFLTGLLAISSVTTVFATTQCTTVPNHCVPDQNNPGYYVCTALQGNINITIGLNNYAQMITDALTGQQLGPTQSLIMCVAETAGTNWEAANAQPEKVPYIDFMMWSPTAATESDAAWLPGTLKWFGTMIMPLNGEVGSPYHLYASTENWNGSKDYTFCACGLYSPGDPECTYDFGTSINGPLNSLLFHASYGYAGATLGECNTEGGSPTGTGGMWITVFAPKGTIPAMGEYSTTLTIEATSNGPFGPLTGHKH
jgi:hypothetical protein